MKRSWYPVSPDRTEDGALASLVAAGIPHGQALPVPSEGGDLSLGEAEDRELDLAASLSFGLVGTGSASSTFTSRTVVRELFVYEEVFRKNEDPGAIRATHWGAGMRLSVSIMTSESAVQLNVGLVAALVEAGGTTASFELHGIGIPSREVFGSIPVFGQLNRSTYDQILEAEVGVRTYLQDNLDRLQRVPLRIWMDEPLLPEPPLGARGQLFALQQLATGASLRRARRRAARRNIARAEVDDVYQQFDPDWPASPSRTPTDGVRKESISYLKDAGFEL